jgi:hypothetical protein
MIQYHQILKITAEQKSMVILFLGDFNLHTNVYIQLTNGSQAAGCFWEVYGTEGFQGTRTNLTRLRVSEYEMGVRV